VSGHYEPPLSPVFRWKADETQPQGGSWENASHSHTDRTRVDGLLHAVHSSHGGTMQTAAVAAAAAAVVADAGAAAERLRTPTEEKRYPLSTALTYDPVQKAVSAAPVLSARFKWENVITGTETRRSGEIKKTDPAYSDVRGRTAKTEVLNWNGTVYATTVNILIGHDDSGVRIEGPGGPARNSSRSNGGSCSSPSKASRSARA